MRELNLVYHFSCVILFFIITKKEFKRLFVESNVIDFCSKLKFVTGKMFLASDSLIGEHTNELDIALSISEEQIQLVMNNNFILSALNNCPTNTISVRLSKTRKVIIIKSIGSEWTCSIAGMG